jgi:4-hydroxy-3-methylbut-2-en-1-yl diphosphate reductase
MNVTIDPHSGFCFGVDRAIQLAEQELQKAGILFCLGEIVHNQREVLRLKDMGLRIIESDEFEHLKNCKVLIRAHGEPPETYRIALNNNIELIDATCPVVLKLQKQIRLSSIEMEEKDGQVVIYGKEGHAEVKGLLGQTGGKAIPIGGEADLERIDYSRPVRLFSQTTMSSDGLKVITNGILERMTGSSQSDRVDFTLKDSICRQVSNRSAQLQEFASRFDTIIFVSGKKSSNGLSLFEVCRRINPSSYLVSGKEDLKKEWTINSENVGICGATSTPVWLMEEVRDEIIRSGNYENVP